MQKFKKPHINVLLIGFSVGLAVVGWMWPNWFDQLKAYCYYGYYGYGACTEAAVDIKPGKCPNIINVKSKGRVSVAILGTTDYDVNDIDPDTVHLDGAWPIQHSIRDVATPYEPLTGKINANECNNLGPDGIDDLVFRFKNEDIVETLGEVNDQDVITLILYGMYSDGTISFVGEDVIVVKKKGRN